MARKKAKRRPREVRPRIKATFFDADGRMTAQVESNDPLALARVIKSVAEKRGRPAKE